VRVATYTRISTDEAHQPYSLPAQAERLSSYIASQPGWSRTREFTDQMTGAVLERPGLERALMEARAHRYDLLLVYRVDRLARSVERWLTSSRSWTGRVSHSVRRLSRSIRARRVAGCSFRCSAFSRSSSGRRSSNA
jgi:Resolvase, N terminal domain